MRSFTSTEQLGTQLKDLLAQYEKELAPAVILIPGKEGSLGIGMETDNQKR